MENIIYNELNLKRLNIDIGVVETYGKDKENKKI